MTRAPLSILYASYRMASKDALQVKKKKNEPKYPGIPDWYAPPLIKAILDNRPDMVSMLIENGEDVNREEDHDYAIYGKTPLAVALAIAKRLKNINTPLAFSKSLENDKIIRILIDAGATQVAQEEAEEEVEEEAEQEGGRSRRGRRGRSRRGRRNRKRRHTRR